MQSRSRVQAGTAVGESVSAPMREFLEWVRFRPRTHADVVEAWSSHCPRFTLWEDALDAGLVELDPGPGPAASARVRLTSHGQAARASVSDRGPNTI
jgi:hypothetical protein